MKRASLKGLGESIFFVPTGDQETASPLPGNEIPGPSKATSVSPDTETSARPDVPTPGRSNVQTAGRSDVPMAGRADVQTSVDRDQEFFRFLEMPMKLKRQLRAVLREERRIHTTVRFSPDEMSALRDLVYQLEAKMGIKITRNEVMRIALHFFLEDYELRKKESLLLQVLEEVNE